MRAKNWKSSGEISKSADLASPPSGGMASILGLAKISRAFDWAIPSSGGALSGLGFAPRREEGYHSAKDAPMSAEHQKYLDELLKAVDSAYPPSGGIFSDLDIERALGKCPGTPRTDAPIVDRFGTSRNSDDVLTRTSGRAAFENFIRPELSAQLGQTRENAPFAAPVSKAARAMILDDLIRTLDANGLDSSWLRELKSIDFPIIFQDTGENDSEAGTRVDGMVLPDSQGGFKVLMNAHNFTEYSPEMKAKLLHELRHVWQRRQNGWKSKFGDGVNSKTDVDVEVDAFERQFEIEKVLGVEPKYLRNFFDEINGRESLNPVQKRHQKAKRLYDSVGYKPTGRYYLKERDEYEQEYGK